MWLNNLSISKLDKWLYLTLCLACDYLPMLGLKLIQVSIITRQYYNFQNIWNYFDLTNNFTKYDLAWSLLYGFSVIHFMTAWWNTDTVNTLKPEPFCRWHFQIGFLQWKWLKNSNLNIFLGVYFAVCVHVMACCYHQTTTSHYSAASRTHTLEF